MVTGGNWCVGFTRETQLSPLRHQEGAVLREDMLVADDVGANNLQGRLRAVVQPQRRGDWQYAVGGSLKLAHLGLGRGFSVSQSSTRRTL